MALSRNEVPNRLLPRRIAEAGLAIRRRRRFPWNIVMREAVPMTILTLGAALVALPLLWMFSTSLRPSAESYKLPPQWLPTQFHWENYGALFDSSVPFLMLFFNSLKITVSVTVGQLVFCSMAGFAFARLKFPGRQILFVLLLASLMIPNQVTVIPIFLIMKTLGLIDTHLSIILPGLVSAFGVFLLRQFYLTLPQELIDAAKLDGASPWKIYTRIALPLIFQRQWQANISWIFRLSSVSDNPRWNARLLLSAPCYRLELSCCASDLSRLEWRRLRYWRWWRWPGPKANCLRGA
jgi:multiple sugar transport system permease protein